MNRAPKRRRSRPSSAPIQARRKAGAGASRTDSLRAVYSGKLLRIKVLLRSKKRKQALALARRWRERAPGSMLALVGLGEVLQALGRRREAARAFGSLVDLFPSRADLRRYAGNRLSALGKAGLRLARDTYAKAVAQRPDHAHGYRLLAYTQVRLGQPGKAFETLEAALSRSFPRNRFTGVKRILRADLGLVARVILQRRPLEKRALQRRLQRHSAKFASGASTRAVLTWETDANDMDLSVGRSDSDYVYEGSPEADTTEELYQNVTNGFGPECVVFPKGRASSRYRLRVTYASRGAMGYGLGTVSVLRHDGRGGLRFDERPFVIMKDGATVKLGAL